MADTSIQIILVFTTKNIFKCWIHIHENMTCVMLSENSDNIIPFILFSNEMKTTYVAAFRSGYTNQTDKVKKMQCY